MERACETCAPDATQGVPVPLEHAAHELRERAAAAEGGGWRRWTLRVPGAPSPAEWVCACRLRPRALFESRDGHGEYAGAGVAMVYQGEDARRMAARALRELPAGCAFFGAERFDPARAAGRLWSGFGQAYYFLPRWELARRDGVTELSLVARPGERVGWDAGDESPRSVPLPAPSQLEPSRAEWHAEVGRVLGKLETSALRKVVLARQSQHHLGNGLPRAWVARASGDCFRFLLEANQQSGIFLGLSPELLFRRVGRRVESEAVAGTRSRGSSREEKRRAEELASSAKDLEEFGLVVQAIGDFLGPLCEDLQIEPTPSILPAGSVIHLRRAFHGRLREGVDDLRLLSALHPTPATCGEPRIGALNLIRESEPFDRGFYAGPVGRMSREATEFAVGIRSALLRGEEAYCYAGAGIVPSSCAEAEWLELDRKAAVLQAAE